jgi:hypothetical protein
MQIGDDPSVYGCRLYLFGLTFHLIFSASLREAPSCALNLAQRPYSLLLSDFSASLFAQHVYNCARSAKAVGGFGKRVARTTTDFN